VASFCFGAPASAAKLTVSPTSHDYGTAVLGASTASQSFAVADTGKAASVALSVAVTGADAADFVIDADSCTAALAAGSACTVSVHFVPSAEGTRKAMLSVSGSPGGTATSSLQGTGATAHLALSPASHGYGSVTIGADSDPVQDFSYEAGAGTDCTATFVDTFDSQLTCPVPAIAVGATYTRNLTEQNLSSQAPKYISNQATTIMPGDTDSSNNTGYAFVTFD
jgi:hypothetical protein